jgi:hypothetical protein
MALYDSENKTYKLGIICDLTNENDSNSRKELFHQEKFLKAKEDEMNMKILKKAEQLKKKKEKDLLQKYIYNELEN